VRTLCLWPTGLEHPFDLTLGPSTKLDKLWPSVLSSWQSTGDKASDAGVSHMAKLTQAQAQAQADMATLEDELGEWRETNLAPTGDDALVSAHNALVLRFAELEKRFAALENQSAPAPAIVAPTSEDATPIVKKAKKAKASAPAPVVKAPTPTGTLRVAKTKAEATKLRTGAGASNSTRYVCSCGISGYHDKMAAKHIAKGHDVVQVGA
jgi:hypothetical protein